MKVMFGSSLPPVWEGWCFVCDDRGMKTSTQKLKDPLSFEILIFRNGLPDRDDDRKICVAMPLTLGATWPCLSSFLRCSCDNLWLNYLIRAQLLTQKTTQTRPCCP
jgi:hypothetical protein